MVAWCYRKLVVLATVFWIADFAAFSFSVCLFKFVTSSFVYASDAQPGKVMLQRDRLDRGFSRIFCQNRGLRQINGMNAIEAFPGLRGFSRILRVCVFLRALFLNRGLHGLHGLTRILRVSYLHI